MSTPRPNGLRSRIAATRLYYGWVVVAGCFLGSLTVFATIYSFGVFFTYILDTFGQSYANTSLVLSLQAVVTFGGGAVLGLVIDRYGVRRLLALGALLLGAGLFAASQASSFLTMVIAYGVIAAAGLSLIYVISYATAPRWFERRRGLATAIATAGGGVGILTGPPLASALITRLGWQSAYLTLSGLFVSVLLIVAFLIEDDPATMGVDVGTEFSDTPVQADAAGDSWREQVGRVLTVARSRAFALAFVGYVLIGVPINLPPAHMVEFTESAGVGRGIGVLALSVIGALNVVGKFLVGPVSDRVGIPQALTICGFLLGTGTLLLAGVRAPATVLGTTVIFGLGYGGAIALLSPMLAELFGTADLNALFGLTSLSFAVTGATVPYFAGVGFDIFGSYTPAFAAAGVLGLLAAGVIAVSTRVQPAA